MIFREFREGAILPSLLAAGLAGATWFCASASPTPKPAAAASPQRAAETGTPDVPPDAFAGNWLVEMKIGSRSVEGSLHFSNANGVLVGSWTGSDGGEWELKKIAIKGNQISWDADGPGGGQHVEGKIDGLSMKGTMKRASTRRSGSRGNSGQTGDGGDADAPPANGEGSGRSGGGYGRGGGGGRSGGGGRRGGGRSGSGESGITWSAYKSMAPDSVTPGPAPVATPGPAGVLVGE